MNDQRLNYQTSENIPVFKSVDKVPKVYGKKKKTKSKRNVFAYRQTR